MSKSGCSSDEKKALWLVALEKKDLARMYFSKKRVELSESVFGVFDGFGTDERMESDALKRVVKLDEDVT